MKREEPKVLRTVYLPSALDEALRLHAFRSGKLKGEVIIEALEPFLKANYIPAPGLSKKK